MTHLYLVDGPQMFLTAEDEADWEQWTARLLPGSRIYRLGGTVDQIPRGCIVMLDEIDPSVTSNRSSEVANLLPPGNVEQQSNDPTNGTSENCLNH